MPGSTCAKCGAVLSEGNKFCPECGAPLSPELGPTVAGATVVEDAVPAPSRSEQFHPGQKIAGRYRIVSLLGRGGMGEVYRADDLQLGQSVALKFLKPRIAADPLALDRFRKEVRMARGVSHRNVCRIHDIGEAEGRTFISMEYVDGEDLASAIKRLGRPSREKALAITRQIVLGLAAVHDAGVVHRDLKPSNIMIDGRGDVRLMDFGIAGLGEELARQSQTAGTPLYMAPELFAGGKASVRSDIYALGLVLYELFTGQRAYAEAGLHGLTEMTDTRTPTTPSSLIADMDPVVERAILGCLENDPNQRPASAYGLLSILPGGDPLAAAVAAGQTPSPEMVAAAGDEGAMKKRTARFCLAGVGLGLLAMSLMAGFSYEVNQIEEWKHPQVLAERVRALLETWGYDEKPGNVAMGFVRSEDKELKFWYRRSLDPYYLRALDLYSSWGRLSYGKVSEYNPGITTPGEIKMRLEVDGRLNMLRVRPRDADASRPRPDGDAPWGQWFAPEVIGFDLAGWTPVQDKELPPPVPYDQIRVWRGRLPGQTNEVYLEAASYRGRPVFLEIIGLEEMESGRKLFFEVDSRVGFGRSSVVLLYLGAVVAAAVLAWRNFRSGHSDRRGSFRVAFAIFVLGMLAWVLLADHRLVADSMAGLLELGLAQALMRAGIFWIFYTALEPLVRKLWPQTLISWTRLTEGRWKDPLVCRDLLLGAFLAVIFNILLQLTVLAPPWLDLEHYRFLYADKLAIEGAASLAGYSLVTLIELLWKCLFVLFLYLILRLVLRRTVLVWLVFIILIPPTMLALDDHHPVLGWGFVIPVACTFLWVVPRFGYLAVLVWFYCRAILLTPVTLDFSAWYSAHGLLGPATVAAMAGWGFYHLHKGKG